MGLSTPIQPEQRTLAQQRAKREIKHVENILKWDLNRTYKKNMEEAEEYNGKGVAVERDCKILID